MSATPDYLTVQVPATITLQLPRTFTAQTDPETTDHCLHHYYRVAHTAFQYNGHIFPFATMQAVTEALSDGGAVTVLYSNERGEVSARTIFPHSITLTKENHITCWGFCTYRRENRSFRLDAMRCVQMVVTPAEAA